MEHLYPDLLIDTQNVSIYNNSIYIPSYLISSPPPHLNRLNAVNCYHFIAVLNCDRLIAVESDVRDDERQRTKYEIVHLHFPPWRSVMRDALVILACDNRLTSNITLE